MSDFEVMPIGTAARLAELEAENKGLRFALSRQGKSTMPEMVALRAEVERLRADAERYQWLRGPLVGRGIRVIMPTPYPAILSGVELDREIDAAIK